MTTSSSTTSIVSDDDSPKEASVDPLIRKVEEIAAKSKARNLKRESENKVDEQSNQLEEKAPKVAARFAKSTHTRLAAIERDMQRMEHDGYFVSFPIRPENEFPTLLTRLPIFRPTRRRHQHRLQNVDNAIEFSTPFGTGKRHGPPLTVRDEDTLIALMRLRSRRLIGNPRDLPVSVSDIYKTQTGNVGVHYVACTVDQINTEMGLTNGGSNFNATFESVKRLGATQLELNLNKHDRYLNLVTTGRMIPIIQVQWQVHDNDGLLVILFPPVIAQWLDKEYTYVNWNIRKELGDLAKALHRFLSSQPKRYETTVLKICETVGYDGPTKNAKQRLSGALEEMIKVGWLSSYEFEGTGRKTPLTLKTERL